MTEPVNPGRDVRTGRSRPARVVAAVIVLIAAAAAACSSPDQLGSTAPSAPAPTVPTSTTAPAVATTPAAAPQTTPQGPVTITIAQFLFAPETITVPAGAVVVVDNQDSANHTVTADDGSFDTGNVAGKAMGMFTAPTKPGTYPYKCAIHPFMTGTLTVT